MSRISEASAREALDSRSNPAAEVGAPLGGGSTGRADRAGKYTRPSGGEWGPANGPAPRAKGGPAGRPTCPRQRPGGGMNADSTERLITAGDVIRRFGLASLGPTLLACEALSVEGAPLDVTVTLRRITATTILLELE